jgi:hypothetical protein
MSQILWEDRGGRSVWEMRKTKTRNSAEIPPISHSRSTIVMSFTVKRLKVVNWEG